MNCINYKYNTLTVKSIEKNLIDWNTLFCPPITSYVADIYEYAKKIHNNALTIEAYYKNNLIGWLAIYVNQEKAFITHFAINKDFQHLGIGTKLLKIATKKANHCSCIELECFINNKTALNFYKKFGFVQIEENNNKYKLSYLL